MPKQWYNLRADMKDLPDPLLNPGTGRTDRRRTISRIL